MEEDTVTALLNQRKYEEARDYIKRGEFDSSRHERLVNIWDEVHYRDVQDRNTVKTLTPLMKFRIRKRHPPPPSICPGGVRPSSKMSPDARVYLRDWFEKHQDNPYPSASVREELAGAAAITPYQVKNWFANQRRRMRAIAEAEKPRSPKTVNTPPQKVWDNTVPALKFQVPWESSVGINRRSNSIDSTFRIIDTNLVPVDHVQSFTCIQSAPTTSSGASGFGNETWNTHLLPVATPVFQEYRMHPPFQHPSPHYNCHGSPVCMSPLYGQVAPTELELATPRPLVAGRCQDYIGALSPRTTVTTSTSQADVFSNVDTNQFTERDAVMGLLNMGNIS